MSGILDVLMKTDFKLLHEQKVKIWHLVNTLEHRKDDARTENEEKGIEMHQDALEGILSFLDCIQEAAEAEGIAVYMPEDEDEEET